MDFVRSASNNLKRRNMLCFSAHQSHQSSNNHRWQSSSRLKAHSVTLYNTSSKMVWENNVLVAQSVLHKTAAYFHSWNSVYAKRAVIGISVMEAVWEPPPDGFVKCNFDAALFPDSGKVGFALVVRGSHGEFVSAHSIK
ncbi:hypothetical protein OROHE_013401 [Orobanche hederae]